MIQKFDFLIIGSGIAGMSFALKVAHKGKVALICKTELEEANTYFAQGGVASVTNTLVDNFEKHPAPQGQHGCGNSRQPDTGCQTTPQHHYFRKAFRHRDSYATPPRSNCYAADSRHRMLRRLCARFENR